MQSVFRFLLAALVVLAHLTEGVRWTAHMGVFAVFGFYLISGFLITLILNETYKFDFRTFAVNRFLRLYPIYYLACALTLWIIFQHDDAAAYKGTWATSDRVIDYVGNLLIFPFEFYDSNFRLVPPAWSVAVELVCYFLLWLLITRSKWLALAVFVLSIGYHAYTYTSDPAWQLRYAPFQSALLPFSLGALIYFARARVASISAGFMKVLAVAAFMGWITNLLVCGLLGAYKAPYFDAHFYANLILEALILLAISHPAHIKRATGISKLLGDLAYPIFLIHWQIGFLVYAWFDLPATRGWPVLFYAIPLILFVSFVFVKVTDRLIEPARNWVRPNAATSTSEPLKTGPVTVRQHSVQKPS